MPEFDTDVAQPVEAPATPQPNDTAPPPAAALDALAVRVDHAHGLQDIDGLTRLHADPQTPPEWRARIEDLMVDLLAERASQQGPPEEAPAGGRSKGGGPELPEEAATRDTTLQRLSKMAVSEKVRLALFGTREERFLLIKSVNRIIATAVLKSPKTNDAEVALIASLRNVHLDVLSTIANTPAWTKKRTIALNLIRNPRTPAALSLRLLRQTLPRDLQVIARDHGIPDVVRRTAQRAVAAKKQD